MTHIAVSVRSGFAGGGLLGLRFGGGFRLALGGFPVSGGAVGGLGLRRLLAAGFRFLRLARIVDVPAGPLKNDANWVEQPFDLAPALRAGGDGIVFHALKDGKLMLTLRTLVTVSRQFNTSQDFAMDVTKINSVSHIIL